MPFITAAVKRCSNEPTIHKPFKGYLRFTFEPHSDERSTIKVLASRCQGEFIEMIYWFGLIWFLFDLVIMSSDRGQSFKGLPLEPRRHQMNDLQRVLFVLELLAELWLILWGIPNLRRPMFAELLKVSPKFWYLLNFKLYNANFNAIIAFTTISL